MLLREFVYFDREHAEPVDTETPAISNRIDIVSALIFFISKNKNR
jgi:hypothetical protein